MDIHDMMDVMRYIFFHVSLDRQAQAYTALFLYVEHTADPKKEEAIAQVQRSIA